MNASDISRLLLQPAKRYTSVMLQQGRVVTDADRNEGNALESEDRRAVWRDLIGPSGSPDQGYSLDLQVGDTLIPRPFSYNGADSIDILDYRIRPGALYVEGQRFTQEGDQVGAQADFLQMQANQAPIANPGSTHSHMLYLHAWEQWVSSIEDEEFHEVALGPVDTSTRVRRMSQVHVGEIANDLSCDQAWDAVRAKIESDTSGTFNASGTILNSSARLRIRLVPGEALDPCAPCSPDDPGRYLGADNQTIRIMMAASDRYVFARNNAAAIYRIRIDADATDAGVLPVQLLNVPRDSASWPLRNTVAEVMPWGAVLPNGEKVANTPGVFVRVAQSYDPDTNSFGFDADDASKLSSLTTQWDDAHAHRPHLPNDNDANGDYVYVRFWHQVDNDDDDVLLSTSGTHRLLRRLGLNPVFSGTGIVGDYWTITVRPNTPRSIVPWNLTQFGGVPPVGPYRLYTPLSMVTLRAPQPGEPDNAEVVQTVEDCRPRFNPLADNDGCCTHSVGDGLISVGDYTSIQTAINNLPASGGKICLLPGEYFEKIVIDGDNITIEGCGLDSTITSPGASEPDLALVQVNGANVTLRDFAAKTLGQIAVQINEGDPSGGVASTNIRVDSITVNADQREGIGGQTRSCLIAWRVRQLMVENCTLSMNGSQTDDAAAFVQGADITVQGCKIKSEPDSGTSSAWAGLQIGGQSTGVIVQRNLIRGGVGHGITLGSLVWFSETTTTTFGAGTGLVDSQDPCAPTSVMVRPISVSNTRYDSRSAGDLVNIKISDNRIEDMSANGISVLTMLPLNDVDGSVDRITTDSITIDRNRILGCIDQANRLRDLAPAPKVKKLDSGEAEMGGQFVVSETRDSAIFLVEGEKISIRDNDLINNGVSDPHAVAGVSILYGDSITIEGNRIRNNGQRLPASVPVADTTGSGIFVSLAGVASNSETPNQSDPFGFSLRIHNNIVDHPNGPALSARATGPVSVIGNHLLSNGNNASAQVPGQAACVSITNLGAPTEAMDLPSGEPNDDRWSMPQGTRAYLQRAEDSESTAPRIGLGGRIMFAKNQVTLNWVEESNSGFNVQSGFSVVLCTQDELTCNTNQLSLNVEDPGTKKSGDTVYAVQPRMSAHIVAVGATVNFSRNRIAEGVNDALISFLALGGFLASATDNISTHLSYVSTLKSVVVDPDETADPDVEYRKNRNNIVWLRPALESSGTTLVSVDTVNGVANQLFIDFAASCLGVDLNPSNTELDVIKVITRSRRLDD